MKTTVEVRLFDHGVSRRDRHCVLLLLAFEFRRVLTAR
jgi:hypothetical protein